MRRQVAEMRGDRAIALLLSFLPPANQDADIVAHLHQVDRHDGFFARHDFDGLQLAPVEERVGQQLSLPLEGGGQPHPAFVERVGFGVAVVGFFVEMVPPDDEPIISFRQSQGCFVIFGEERISLFFHGLHILALIVEHKHVHFAHLVVEEVRIRPVFHGVMHQIRELQRQQALLFRHRIGRYHIRRAIREVFLDTSRQSHGQEGGGGEDGGECFVHFIF